MGELNLQKYFLLFGLVLPWTRQEKIAKHAWLQMISMCMNILAMKKFFLLATEKCLLHSFSLRFPELPTLSASLPVARSDLTFIFTVFVSYPVWNCSSSVALGGLSSILWRSDVAIISSRVSQEKWEETGAHVAIKIYYAKLRLAKLWTWEALPLFFVVIK